jgi:hypothetical protein
MDWIEKPFKINHNQWIIGLGFKKSNIFGSRKYSFWIN